MIYFYIYLAGFIVNMIYLKIENYYFAQDEYDHLDIINSFKLSLSSWFLMLFLICAFSYRGIRFIWPTFIEIYENISEKISDFGDMIYESNFFQRIDFWFSKTKFNKNQSFRNVFKN